MKKIVVLSERERPSESLIAHLCIMFPECELAVVTGLKNFENAGKSIEDSPVHGDPLP